jgi:RNA recognition motif-containing protein
LLYEIHPRSEPLFSGSTGSSKVYVFNLPPEIRWEEVKDAFRKEVGEVTHVSITSTEEGKKCRGIVKFSTAELAMKALKLKNFILKDRRVYIEQFVEGRRDQYGFIATSKKEIECESNYFYNSEPRASTPSQKIYAP